VTGDTAGTPFAAATRKVAFSVSLKEWESEFFGRTFGSLAWTHAPGPPASLPEAADALGRVCREADAAAFAVVECHLDVNELAMAAALETVGFKLVDSRIRFVTRFTVADIPDTTPTRGVIVDAMPEHRDRIVELTHAGFTDNGHLVSRFKNPEYFSRDESRRYFEAWIDNTVFDTRSASAVFLVDDDVVGYYIYQARDSREGIPVVKGILTAVEPEHRGANAQLAMQAHLYRKFGFDEWFLDNTTQLTNAPVIRNHIRSAKRLEEIVLTFYRKPPG